MGRRPNNMRLRRLILGIFFLILAIGAFALIFVLAPISDDPEGVGRILGGVAGGLGGIGLITLVVALFTRRTPR